VTSVLHLLFALACIAGLVERLGRTPLPLPAAGKDAISIYLSRFARAHDVLGNAGDVGYLLDQDMGVDSPASRILPGIYLAQHALLPILITREPRSGLYLGDFIHPEAAAKALADPEFELVHDLGNNVLVLRRRR
jgi:hypothetical protein